MPSAVSSRGTGVGAQRRPPASGSGGRGGDGHASGVYICIANLARVALASWLPPAALRPPRTLASAASARPAPPGARRTCSLDSKAARVPLPPLPPPRAPRRATTRRERANTRGAGPDRMQRKEASHVAGDKERAENALPRRSARGRASCREHCSSLREGRKQWAVSAVPVGRARVGNRDVASRGTFDKQGGRQEHGR